jgi:N-acetylated-alpha-linked acidic dipeptidase
VLRFANAEVLPYAFGNFSDTVTNYVREVGRLADDMRDETKEKNRRIADKTFWAVSDPAETYVNPRPMIQCRT